METLKKNTVKIDTEKPYKRLKILVIGDGGVGKTALCKRLSCDTFDPKYTPTIGSDYECGGVTVGKETIKVCMWDCSGHPEFVEVRNEFCKECNCILIVYDITSKKSFHGIEMWIREAAKFKGETEVGVYVCGSKADSEGKRIVSES